MIELLKKNAKWISSNNQSSEYLIRQNFNAVNIREAKIIFGVLGTYEAFINGQRIGDSYYLPLVSDFHKRDNLILGKTPCTEEFTHRTYCTTFDITELLSQGDNTLAINIAGGIIDSLPGIILQLILIPGIIKLKDIFSEWSCK